MPAGRESSGLAFLRLLSKIREKWLLPHRWWSCSRKERERAHPTGPARFRRLPSRSSSFEPPPRCLELAGCARRRVQNPSGGGGSLHCPTFSPSPDSLRGDVNWAYFVWFPPLPHGDVSPRPRRPRPLELDWQVEISLPEKPPPRTLSTSSVNDHRCRTRERLREGAAPASTTGQPMQARWRPNTT